MAQKRSIPIEAVPASDEEETTSSGEEEDNGELESSSEDDQAPKLQKRTSPPRLAQTSKAKSASESGSDSGTESDSESESEDARPSNVKPIASRSLVENPVKNTEQRSKSTLALGKCTSKRSSEVEKDAKDSKRPKTMDSEANGALEKNGDIKKQLFQRLWSEDDEVALLKGVISFIEKKGIDPVKDMNAFHDYIKKSLHFSVALSQLKHKVSRLRKKFENHAIKGKHGEDKTFSKPHDQKLFDLSKKIWGSKGLCGRSKSLIPLKIESSAGVKKTEKLQKIEEKEKQFGSREMEKFDKAVGLATMEDYVMKKGLEAVDGAKRHEMEEKWMKLNVAELELFVRRNELMAEQGKLLLASYKTSE